VLDRAAIQRAGRKLAQPADDRGVIGTTGQRVQQQAEQPFEFFPIRRGQRRKGAGENLRSGSEHPGRGVSSVRSQTQHDGAAVPVGLPSGHQATMLQLRHHPHVAE